MANDKNYYCVGFNWYGNDLENQLPRFVKEAIWENGFDDKYIQKVKSVPVGSQIAAKTSYTRKKDGETISVLEVHGVGTVKENPGDGKTLKVDWIKNFKPFKIDGRGAYRSTISKVNHKANIDLIFGGKRKSEHDALAFKREDLHSAYPLNQILYGPPGTGKTYNTISKAVAIIDGLKEEALYNYYEDREGIKERFEELKDLGQIVFCTFHQSMSYEDFVEGIKPVLIEEDAEESLGYHLEDGLFKRLCVNAKYDFYKKSLSTTTSSNISRSEFFNIAYEELISTFEEKLDKEEKVLLNTKTGSKLYITQISNQLNLKIKHEDGQREKPYIVSKKRLFKLFNHFQNLDEIKSIHKDIRAVIGGANTTAYWAVLSLIYKIYGSKRLSGVIERDVIKHNQDYETIKTIVNSSRITSEKVNETASEKYVLIVDEINRGNISQIFGELITLIEEDKRLGKDESIEVTLPYSKERFGIPPNLYIIGTMNTADRSVEALDAALRRRFSFSEMPPQPHLLSSGYRFWDLLWKYKNVPWDDDEYMNLEKKLLDLFGATKKIWKERIDHWNKFREDGRSVLQTKSFPKEEFDGINLEMLLTTINKRIEKLLDKDHQIGHSYFLSVFDRDDLKSVFQNKIIPLLQEYFFGDYGKIGLVLGKGFLHSEEMTEDIFADFEDYDASDFSERATYTLKVVTDMSDNTFNAAINDLLKK